MKTPEEYKNLRDILKQQKDQRSMSNLTITNEDNMEMMSRYQDKHFDIAIVDPPYNISRLSICNKRTPGSKYKKSLQLMTEETIKWNHLKPTQEYFTELFRVSKEQIIFGANNFILPPSEYFLIWDKKQTVSNFASAEYAWVSMNHWKKPAKVFRKNIQGIYNSDNKRHPTQKPVELYKWILENYAKDFIKGGGGYCENTRHTFRIWYYSYRLP